MGRRLILDTCVLIAFERGRLKPGDFITPGDDVALASITLTELRAGALLADESRRPVRDAAVARAAATFDLLPYTDSVSLKHAELLVWTRRNGSPRGAFDLITAATAAATGRTLVTTDNAAAFAELPGVAAAAPREL